MGREARPYSRAGQGRSVRSMTEQQPYQVLRRYGDVELRSYPAHTVAEVDVTGSFDRAGTAAFRPLFSYISGNNLARRTVAMTAPVVQGPARTVGRTSEKVPMTAPVVQRGPLDEDQATPSSHLVAFVLPAGMTEESAPVPIDPRVRIRTVPASTAAVLRFSGRGTASAFRRRAIELQEAIDATGLSAVGAPRFAQFDPPFTPWFLRRNEVVQDVAEPPDLGHPGPGGGQAADVA